MTQQDWHHCFLSQFFKCEGKLSNLPCLVASVRWARVWTCAVQLLSSRTLLQITITKVITFRSDSIVQGLETKHCLIMQIHGWGQSILLWNRILRSQERSSWPVQTEWDFSGILMGRYQTCIKVNTKGNQPWTFIGRTYAEAKAPVLWPSDGKSWLIEKPLILGKIESKKRRGGRDWDGYLASLTQWAQISKLWEIVEDRETWPAAVPGVTKN